MLEIIGKKNPTGELPRRRSRVRIPSPAYLLSHLTNRNHSFFLNSLEETVQLNNHAKLPKNHSKWPSFTWKTQDFRKIHFCAKTSLPKAAVTQLSEQDTILLRDSHKTRSLFVLPCLNIAASGGV